ncbi:MAG: YdcF family protein [Eubacteriales bacterium]|nr:YdcF family protein [Eubacteriales bacterium]NLO15142.1 YdcF family protein [Clostridiales bacterium]
MAKRKRGRGLMTLVKLLLLGAILFALAFFGLFGYQLWMEHNVSASASALAGSDALIVLGAQVQPDGIPSVQLEWRLEKALAEYQRIPRIIVVCGAKGPDEPATEASVMRQWLIARGVDPGHILMDEDSFNTKENIAHAVALLPHGQTEVTIVTSDYHLPRAMAVAKDLGLEPSGIGSPIKPEYWLKNHTREALAWGKYFLGKILPIDGD